MALELVTGPTEEPVTLAAAKEFLRVETTADDSHITRSIAAARRYCETVSRRALVSQTWRLWMDDFARGNSYWPEEFWPRGTWTSWGASQSGENGQSDSAPYPGEIFLPYPKLLGVTQIKYVDTAGVLQTLDPSAYVADTIREPGRVLPAFGTSWPAVRVFPNTVQITFTSGYGTAAAVDERATQALLMLAGHWYENREAVITGTIAKEVELGVKALLIQLWDGKLR